MNPLAEISMHPLREACVPPIDELPAAPGAQRSVNGHE